MLIFLKVLWWVVKIVGILLLLYLAAALLLPLIAVNTQKPTAPANRLAYLHGNGIHVDLIFAAAELDTDFLRSIGVDAAAKYVAFGWGDQGFYLNTPTWGDLTVKTALEAALINSPTAMHITDHFKGKSEWRKVPLTETQFSELLAYIKSGFARNEAGAVLPIPDRGYTEDDRFFQGTGSYNALQTCNSWVNHGLKEVGVKTALWAAHEKGLLRHFPEHFE